MTGTTTVIATASRGACPACRESAPIDEDGWHNCRDCEWQFKVEATLDGYMQLVARQPAPVVLEIKSRVMIGLLGIKPRPGAQTASGA